MTAIAALAESAAPSTSQWVLIAAIVIGTVTVLNMRRRRRPLDGSPKQYRREIDSAAERNAQIKGDMEQLLVELAELSRETTARIETRFAKLEKSIADADRRIAALRTLIAASKSIGAGAVDEIADGPAAACDEPIAAAKNAPAGAGDSRHDRIYALADRGMTAVQIAHELQGQVGEVELILNLRGRTANKAEPR